MIVAYGKPSPTFSGVCESVLLPNRFPCIISAVNTPPSPIRRESWHDERRGPADRRRPRYARSSRRGRAAGIRPRGQAAISAICTFRQLDQDSDRIARGLRQLGVPPGTRLALLVRPGIDFISLVFGLVQGRGGGHPDRSRHGPAKSDPLPGRGRAAGIRGHPGRACRPDACCDGVFRKARWNVTVGRRWFWGGVTLINCAAARGAAAELAPTTADDPAAIIFTTGSTGPAKGVLYRHGNFDAQVDQIRDFYGIQPGEVDLPGFPLFGLFNCAMGVTAVIPDMDPSRPAQVDPAKIVEAVRDWQVTQAFGSPAIWNRVGRYCEQHGIRLPTVRRVLSAGAPVPAEVLERMRAVHPSGRRHPHPLWRHRGPAGGVDFRHAKCLGETAAANPPGGRRLRGTAAFPASNGR